MISAAIQDSLLVGRAQSGDRVAFDQLVSRHSARAYQYAFRLTRSTEEAGDIVADAFVRIFRSLKNFKGASAFSTWLFRIETNCFLDMRKKQKSRPSSSLDAAVATMDGEVGLQIEDFSPSPHDEAERMELNTTLQSAVEKLPGYYRTIIVMYHSQMLSYEEISASLGLPLGTVKSRLNRARAALRDILTPNEMFASTLATA